MLQLVSPPCLVFTVNAQGRAAIDNFVAGMDGDRARRTKWNGLAAELDAELKIVKVWASSCTRNVHNT